MIKLHRCTGRCNTVNDSSNKLCVPNKTEYLSLRMFQSMFHENVNANLMKQNARHINGGITININVSVKNIICEKDYVWNPASCSL